MANAEQPWKKLRTKSHWLFPLGSGYQKTKIKMCSGLFLWDLPPWLTNGFPPVASP